MSEFATDVNAMREIYFSVEVQARLHCLHFIEKWLVLPCLWNTFVQTERLANICFGTYTKLFC